MTTLFPKGSLLKERSKYDFNDIKIHENINYLNESKFKIEKDLQITKQLIDISNKYNKHVLFSTKSEYQKLFYLARL